MQAHRPGVLKQSNKAHKTGRHRSKGAVLSAFKGKGSFQIISRKHKVEQTREQKRNQSNQIRKNKREEAFNKKRNLGTITSAPFLVCVLPLHEGIDPKSALAILENCDSECTVTKSPSGATYITIPRFKQRFSFVIPPTGRGNELVALDYLKVCDTTLCLVSAVTGTDEDTIFDKWGKSIAGAGIAQGMPTPIIALMDLESINPKRKSETKANIQKFVSKIFPGEKLMTLDTNPDGLNILRRIGGQKKKVLHNQANRPHMYGEQVEFVPSLDDSDKGLLKVSGYLRGNCNLNVNGLVHLIGLGDFQMKQISSTTDPFRGQNDNDTVYDTTILAVANVEEQTSLIKENVPDPLDAEQTFPTDEEIAAAQQENKKKKLIKRIPKGMSDYQACWIPDIEEVEENEDDDDDNDESDDDSMAEDEMNEDYMSCESNPKSDEEEDDSEEYDSVSGVENVKEATDARYDQNIDIQEERESFVKIKEARLDQQFPDEIDTPLDIPARERFQKYRGLESFKTSPWDVKENLPVDYARIFQFQNFDRTKRRIIKEIENIDGVEPGNYYTIEVLNVPKTLWHNYLSGQEFDNNKPFVILYGLLPHEHQMCVMNVMLKRTGESKIPIKSKERLIFQCGYRRFIVNPLFSQHTNLDKHKYERYFQPDSVVVATFFAPIQFPPAKVLCFKENPDTTLRLVATGSVLSCNPDRVILKRVVLSAHPMKINRKSGTFRYMFYNKEDIEYYKPIRLQTRCGNVGNIKESLGTHGHMKCVFRKQLKSFDTVFLYLYKRVYPKWTYEDCIVQCPKGEQPIKDAEMKE